ncbi:MAG: MucR family transcriptional regulator [Alphaproteobacteria bacterium]|nr:MucR family transcriptional regulator [Alphaproteobacteria bacterium]
MATDAYRTKWGLPSDYPMVALGYAATSSAPAKSNGLARKPPHTSAVATKRTKAVKTSA